MRSALDLNVTIPMRDGIELSADVLRPDDDERHPVLVHTPYMGRRSWPGFAIVLNPLSAVERGYAVVLADIRGTERSGGVWEPFYGHAQDGYDIVEWSAAQPWSNGNVGMWGSSGMGVTTLQTAVAAPPHLRTIVSLFTGGNYFEGWAYTSGVFELWSQGWSRGQAFQRLVHLPDSGEHESLRESLLALVDDPWSHARQLPLLDEERYPAALSPWYYEWLRHPRYDDYWRRVDGAANAASIRVPVFQIAGWYDLFLPGQIAVHQALQEHPDETVRRSSRLLVGPWVHDSYIAIPSSAAGARDFGRTADIGWTTLPQLVLDWFDRFLAAEPRSDGGAGGVRYFLMGDNEWVETASWPPPVRSANWYLQSTGRANTRMGDGVLSREPPADEPVDSFAYDPFDPVPTTGGPTMSRTLGVSQGIADQAAVEEREDVLVYTSHLLDEPLRIAGRPQVVLFAATSALDTDFTAKLVDVEPDGFCANVAEGIVRGRHREGTDRETLLTPNRLTEFVLSLNDVAHTFRLGHRIRIDVSSSNFPRFARNLNSAVHPHEAVPADAVVAVQQIHHTRHAPSRLILPVVDG